MPASSAALITAELGRIVAVSSSNQTTSAARLNWLITQLTLTGCALKLNGRLSCLGAENKEGRRAVFATLFTWSNGEFGSKRNENKPEVVVIKEILFSFFPPPSQLQQSEASRVENIPSAAAAFKTKQKKKKEFKTLESSNNLQLARVKFGKQH